MRTFSKVAMLLAGFFAALVAIYWFFQATLIPVNDTGQQTVQVLYNVHGALWVAIAVLAFGFTGIFARLETSPETAVEQEESPREAEPPAAFRERPLGKKPGLRERVEPRL